MMWFSQMFFMHNNSKNGLSVPDTAFDVNRRLTDNGCYGVMYVG